MLKWVDSWQQPAKSPKKRSIQQTWTWRKPFCTRSGKVKTKCELPNSFALCVVQFVAQKFDMNQVPRVALAKFRAGTGHLLRRTTDARVGHGPEMLTVVTLSFKPGQKQETNRRSEERLSQPGIARAEERRAGVARRRRRRVSEAATHLVKPQPQRSYRVALLSLLIRIASAHLCAAVPVAPRKGA